MNKLKRGLFTVLLVAMIMLLTSMPVYAQGDGQNNSEDEANLAEENLVSVDRIEGDNRYLTAIEVSKAGWDSAHTVVLARGDDYADALTSVPLAHKNEGPILLTPSNKLLDSTKAELERLGTSKVIIVGGESAVTSNVESAIRAEGIEVTRIAGKDRFETATLILDEFDERVTQVVIANGLNFPDALSVAPYAADAGVPILLTRADKLPTVTKEKLIEREIDFSLVVGGTKVVSDNVWFDIPGYKYRIGGENRFSTNVIMAEDSWFDSHMFIATGMDYADALTGAVLAAKHETGVLLVRPNSVPEVVSNFIQEYGITSLSIFGGSSAVSDGVRNELEGLLQ